MYTVRLGAFYLENKAPSEADVRADLRLVLSVQNSMTWPEAISSAKEGSPPPTPPMYAFVWTATYRFFADLAPPPPNGGGIPCKKPSTYIDKNA
jgi:hypothetical protein